MGLELIGQPLAEHVDDTFVELSFVFEIEGEFFGGEQANRHPDAGVSQGEVLLQARFDEFLQGGTTRGQDCIAQMSPEISHEDIVLKLQNRTKYLVLELLQRHRTAFVIGANFAAQCADVGRSIHNVGIETREYVTVTNQSTKWIG